MLLPKYYPVESELDKGLVEIFDTCSPRCQGAVGGKEGGMLCDFDNYDTMRLIADSRGGLSRHQTLSGYHNRFITVSINEHKIIFMLYQGLGLNK